MLTLGTLAARSADRTAAGEKGGRLARRTILAKPMDQLAEGVIGIAEALGDLLLRQAVRQDGPQGLILALPGTGGHLEAALAQGIVHNGWPKCAAIDEGSSTDQVNRRREVGPGGRGRPAGKAGPAGARNAPAARGGGHPRGG